MNVFVSVLQGELANTNQFLAGALREIKGVYVALDKLDKDYIDGIVQSLKKAKKAIDKAEESLEKANTSLSQVKKNSEQNTRTLQALQLTISQLSTFRQEVDKVLPLIPKHTQALDEASRGLKQANATINTLEKRFPLFQRQTQEAIDQAGKRLAENLEEKMAAVNADAEKRLAGSISDAQVAAEEKAAEQLAEAERRITAGVTEAKIAAETKAAEQLADAEKRLAAGISEAKAAAENKAAEQLAEAEKRLAAGISEAQAAAETKSAEQLAEAEKRLIAGISDARSSAEAKAEGQLAETEKKLTGSISDAQAAAETKAAEQLTEAEKGINEKFLQIQQNVQESIKENSEATRGHIEKTDNSLRRRIVLSYIIGGVGIICSAVTLILSLLHVI